MNTQATGCTSSPCINTYFKIINPRFFIWHFPCKLLHTYLVVTDMSCIIMISKSTYQKHFPVLCNAHNIHMSAMSTILPWVIHYVPAQTINILIVLKLVPLKSHVSYLYTAQVMFVTVTIICTSYVCNSDNHLGLQRMIQIYGVVSFFLHLVIIREHNM